MDDNERGRSSPHPRQRATSADSPQGSAAAQNEHADSRVRKRPRLDAGTGDDSVMSEDSVSRDTTPPSPLQNINGASADLPPDSSVEQGEPAATSKHPLTRTPSKVTLNLRPPKPDDASPPSSSAEQAVLPEPVSDPNRQESQLAHAGPNDVHKTPSAAPSGEGSGDSPLSSVQSPVVEIEVDDPEDVGNGEYDTMIDVVGIPSYEIHLIDRFPFAQEQNGANDAVKLITAQFATGDISPAILRNIGDWITEWLEFAKNRRGSWDSLYAEDIDFWANLAVLYFRVLGRRTTFGPFSAAQADGGRFRAVQSFFEPFIYLCGHFVHIDLVSLRDLSGTSAITPELLSFRHVRDLDIIFQSILDVPFWGSLDQKYRLNVDQLQKQLIISAVRHQPGLFLELAEFTRLVALNVHVWGHVKVLNNAVTALMNITAWLKTIKVGSGEATLNSFQTSYTKKALEVVQVIEGELQQNVGKQTAALPIEASINLAKCAGRILQEICIIDSDLANNLLETEHLSVDDISPDDRPKLLAHLFTHKLLWKFVSKGRMELRAQSVFALARSLVELYSQHVHRENGQSVLDAAANLLLREKMVEYLVSVDSHPQLIMRSNDVTGFLLVTKNWSQHLTDAIWSTITSSQDPRVVSSTLEMMNSILHLAQPPALAGFCENTGQVTPDKFTPTMITFADRLLDAFRFDEAHEMFHHVPFEMCIRLIKGAWSDRVNPQLTNLGLLRSSTSEMLGRLSHRGSTASSRRTIYENCIKDVVGRTPHASGSIEIIRCLLLQHTPEDLPTLVDDLEIYRILVEEICAFVESQRHSSDQDAVLQHHYIRLRLLSFLMIYGPPPLLSPALERGLWEHLTGELACSNASRDQSWHFLCEVTKPNNRTNAFIDRFISEYLPNLSPQFFSAGLFSFVETSMQYRQRVSPPPSPADNHVIKIPLSDLLWKIILRASDLHVERSAEILLSRHHLDTPLMQRAPASCIGATHAALVNHCIAQLKESASKLKAYTDGTSSGEDEPMIIVPTQDEVAVEEMRFTRTLKFLRQFLQDVKQRPMFRDQATPSIASAPESPVESNSYPPLTIKYQIIGSAVKQEMRDLTIGSLATFADLHAKLERLTGASEFRNIIQGGAKLHLKSEPTRRVEAIANKGHLIVQCFGDRIDASGNTISAMGNCVAERTVLEHLDVLYEFLGLEEKVAAVVFDFLSGFPPHPRVRAAVLSDVTTLAELFPGEKHIKTLYSLRSMKEHLRHLPKEPADEDFILHGIRVLTTALTESGPSNSFDDGRQDKLVALVDCLYEFLKERLQHNDLGLYIVRPSDVAQRLFRLLELAEHSPASPLALKSAHVYSSLLEAAFHCRELWECFVSQTGSSRTHYWLLTANAGPQLQEEIRVAITSVCLLRRTASAVDRSELMTYYWNMLCGLLPEATKEPMRSKNLFLAAVSIFENYKELQHDAASLKSYFEQWAELLSKYEHHEVPGREEVDDVVFGLARLLNISVSSLKSLGHPINGQFLLGTIFKRYLFPPIDLDDLHQFPLTPVLDEETRKELYTLLLGLCEDPTQYEKLVDWCSETVDVESKCHPPLWNSDRSRWLRSPLGYSGLKNLTNTCYMNSLLTQLFMNANFRKFMLEANVADAHGSQKLLGETQTLFANMQNKSDKYADTLPFAEAVKPYEGDHIDVSVQMDVDEFYNLLFDRWEAQILTAEAKQQFRNFYGGQIVTQIKSKDCTHVSERLEPFFAIQCDVKGKRNLTESLKAYVEGDVMEGDNKYKCESCGGQFVNAIKRSCLKDIPDTLIFHLKRFDFDLTALIRSKINDRFEFPSSIDMKHYKVDYLNDPDKGYSDDVFELVGVLVHNGTAETGHYYSYIHLPPTGSSRQSPWVEFNDSEVSEFDPAKLADQCYGGYWDSSGIEYQWIKPYNAYMLFYRRVSALEADRQANASHNGIGPVMNTVPPSIADRIAKDNNLLVRRYCLYGRAHAAFVRSLLLIPKTGTDRRCTETHAVEHKTISMVLDHTELVFSHLKDVPDFGDASLAVQKAAANCSSCLNLTVQWMIQHAPAVQNLLLTCPNTRVRIIWADLIFGLLEELRGRSRSVYGLDSENDDIEDIEWKEGEGALVQVVAMLKAMIPHLGKSPRAWNEYFGLWHSIASLGMPEVVLLLTEDILSDCLELLLIDKHLHLDRSAHHQQNFLDLTRLKRGPLRHGLVRLISLLLKHVDMYGEPIRSPQDRPRLYDPHMRRYPCSLIEQECIRYWDSQGKQLPFLIKVIDGTEQSATHWYPDEILLSLLECTQETQQLARFAATLTHGIDEYFPHAAVGYLKTSLTFCRHCPGINEGWKLIKAVARNAAQMDTMTESRPNAQGIFQDLPATGGSYYLDFLKEAAMLQRSPFPGQSDEMPYLRHVIISACEWAPGLLTYEMRSTRESTLQVLDQLIFAHFPPTSDEAEDGALAIGIHRTRAVSNLFDSCELNVKKIIENSLPRSLLPALMTATRCCASWIDKVLKQDDDMFIQIAEVADDSILGRYHSLAIKAGDWTDLGADDTLSETEWASNFEDDSDEEADI